MNLMFWKKKPDTGSGVEDAQGDSSVDEKAQEPLDPAATKQQASESKQESPKQEASVKIGLAARIKLRFSAFAQYFRRAPAFKAEEHAPGAHGSAEIAQSEVAATTSDPEAQVKLGLIARIKSGLAALVSRFRKTPAPSAEENQGGETPQESKDDAEDSEKDQAKPGLVAQIKSRLAAVVSRFRKTPEPSVGEGRGKEASGSSKESPKSAGEATEESGRLAVFSEYKKYLILVLLLLLLGAGVYAAWDIIFPPLIRKPTPHVVRKPAVQEQASQVQETAPQAPEPVPQAPEQAPQAQGAASQPQETAPPTDIKAINKSEEAWARAEALKKQSEEARAQAEALRKESEAAQARAEELKKKEEEEKARVEVLRKKNEEEKARAEALKKSSRQQQSLQPGEVAVGGGDPKTSAKSLKEAIEAMNNSSGQSPKKSAK